MRQILVELGELDPLIFHIIILTFGNIFMRLKSSLFIKLHLSFSQMSFCSISFKE